MGSRRGCIYFIACGAVKRRKEKLSRDIILERYFLLACRRIKKKEALPLSFLVI